MPARLCLFTEELVPPFDEGYKNFTYHLFKEAPEGRDVLRIGRGDAGVIDRQVYAGKLLLSVRLRKSIREFQPDAVIYVPTASATPASFLRARILKQYSRNAPVAIIGLQPRAYDGLRQAAVKLLRPEAVYVQSAMACDILNRLGVSARVVRAGVDIDRFRPPVPEQRLVLRRKYGLDEQSKIVLHVGHVNARRSLEVLAEVQRIPGAQAVVVGSSSTDQDEELAAFLAGKGVKLLREYVPNIEEIYQLADAYVFPVLESTAAIHFPLSVLEAMACNLPVVTTPFGGLADCFEEAGGLCFAGSTGEILEKLKLVQTVEVRTREIVEPFTWRAVVGNLLSEIDDLVETRRAAGGTKSWR